MVALIASFKHFFTILKLKRRPIMRKMISLVAIVMTLMLLAGMNVWAHCEIPCGIYDDQLRAQLIGEHSQTIEKSMNQIIKMGQETPINHNQLVRWISNKEEHANKIQAIITQYFMTQRIKPTAEKYNEKLTTLHKMLIAAMKCKQTVDLAHVNEIRELLKSFEKLYFGK
jgi:nickel superoxide dismutase